MNLTLADIERAGRAWAQLERALGQMSAAHTEANAARMMDLLDGLLGSGRASSPGLVRFVAFVTEWVQAYDAASTPIPSVEPAELLRHLMKENNLRQVDLAAELGGQPVVSAILRGKRQISAKQARALGQRFAVSPAVFIAQGPIEDQGAEVPQTACTTDNVVAVGVRDATDLAGLTSEKVYDIPAASFH